MTYEVEQIADHEGVTRLIDFPRMTIDGSTLILNDLFPFPQNKQEGGYFGESINWDKYAPPPDAVNALGCKRQASKQQYKPDMRYVGYIQCEAGKVRQVRTARGHSFTLEHRPSVEEGQHHAEIYFAPNPDVPKLSSSDRSELRQALMKAFTDIRAHACDEEAISKIVSAAIDSNGN